MPSLSSCCRCGPGGRPTHEMGKCPHLWHVCDQSCGPAYSSFCGLGPTSQIKQSLRFMDNYSIPPTKINQLIHGSPKPPWEK